MQYVLDLDLEFVIWNWGLILLILGLMRWCAGIIFDFHFWVPRVMSCGGELRRILFYILDSQFPRFFELIIWILGVFESWRDYFRGWILDNFCFSVPRSQVLSFLSLPGSSSFVSGSLVFEFCFLIPKSPEVLEFFNFGSPVSEPCNFFDVPVF